VDGDSGHIPPGEQTGGRPRRDPGSGPEPGRYRDAASMRVSDADRDRVATELGEHFQAGRLTQDEFDERVGKAIAARTRGDLDELLADLPSDRPAGRLPATAGRSSPPVRGMPLCLGPAAGVVAVAAILAVLFAVPAHPGWAPWWLIFVPIFVLLRRSRTWRGGPPRRLP
jgi:DUF1707 SHOCT-like domain